MQQKVLFGLSDDRPAVSDYDGDGKTDIAVFRPSTGFWYVLRSGDAMWVTVQWGTSSDLPVASAYTP